MTWTQLEDAVRAWVVSATGLAADKVIFGEQDGNSPAAGNTPAITVSIGNVHQYTSEGRPDGYVEVSDEIVFSAISTNRIGAVFRCYSPAATGELVARAVLEKVLAQVELPPIREALNAAGLGIADTGDVLAVPRVVATKWESQAILEVAFCAMMTASVNAPYIGRVEGSGTVHSPGSSDTVVPIDVQLEPE